MAAPSEGLSSIGVLLGDQDPPLKVCHDGLCCSIFLSPASFQSRLTTAGFYVNKADPELVADINKNEGTNFQAQGPFFKAPLNLAI